MLSSERNHFLDALSPPSRDLLLSQCVEIDLPLRKSLYEPDQVPRYAYFLTSGVASIVNTTGDGAMVEVGLIGREGVVGSLHVLGPAKVTTRCFIQSSGTSLRMPFAELKKLFRSNAEIQARLLEFTQVQTLSLSQLAACNRLHENEERLARWLLMAQDRTGSDLLELTQEFLGMMLGARRTTVTVIAGVLQRSGLIEYRRGQVKIVDRENLEASACDCYKITQELYAGLYTKPVQD